MTVVERTNAPSDDAFQQLLLRISAAAVEDPTPEVLIRLFCRASRSFFAVDGVYFWRRLAQDELLGIEADGNLAERFRGLRLKSTEQAVVLEAIRDRKTRYVNHLDAARSIFVTEFGTKSVMAAPLVVSNEVIGAAVFAHSSIADFFDDDSAAKATILAGQLGSLLETTRLNQLSREERRRAEILAEVAETLHSVPGEGAVLEAIADRLRMLLRTRLVCILVSQGTGFSLRAVAAESANLAEFARARHDRKGLQFSGELASRALIAGEPITVAVDPASHSLGDLVPPGMLIASPFRTSRSEGCVLIYPRTEGAFSKEERSLVSAITNFGTVALTNAELYSTAQAQARELHQLLDITSELGSAGELDPFMRQFAVRAAEFLGFSRACIGLLEEGKFHIHWKAEGGSGGDVEVVLPGGPVSRALLNQEVFWSNDLRKAPGVDLEKLKAFQVKQLLSVPLVGSGGQVLGMLAVLDHLNGAGISLEDIRRAKVLAAQVAVTLEVTRNLELSGQQRRRAESLVGFALELTSLLRIKEFEKAVVIRTAEMMGARGGALVVKHGSSWETAARHGFEDGDGAGDPLSRRLAHAVEEAVSKQTAQIVSATAKDLFGPVLASALNWTDCVLARLTAIAGDWTGVLCLANRDAPLSAADHQFLQAIVGHASIGLENARLFARMEGANRHWIEIFDAISDFIVVHDQSDIILRVNRSLADFVGVPLQALIGVNMGALLALDNPAPMGSCPFCRAAGDTSDEYMHPALERTYLVSTSRVHGDHGEGLQTIHVLKDITDRREAERRYGELFSNIQEGLFFSTPDGRFIEVNDALVRMLGYGSREELLQAEIGTQVYNSPAQYQKFAEYMSQHGVVRNHEEVLRRKDGSAVYVLINAFAVRDSEDRILQYRGLMLDISGIKNYEVELHRERDFSGKILNNTQSLILVLDPSGQISYSNRRWTETGYQQKQSLGVPMADLVAAVSRQNFADAFQRTLGGQQVDNLDLEITQANGKVGHFSVNLSPMRDEQGQVSSIVVVMTDVTDSATLQAKLMHAEKMAAVGQLVSGVAHEVNNPLTAILGFADLLMENSDLPEAVRKDLRVILQEAQRTKQIVQNLLSFARQMPPQRKPVEINSILRRTVQLRAYDFHSHGVEVGERFDEAIPAVIGDSHQLQQVFLNILNNAYDAVHDIGRPSRIDLITRRKDNLVEISFRDNGHGISYPERIFDPFFTTKEVGKGTGLGLSICYGIVREHGGEIICHNNEEGEGATFIVRLPAVPEAASVGTAAGVQP